ncbi:hypothetical protein CYY_007500 [Polysphondylium violaceum]|uniref:Ankyrin repeat-containing protein n=1 Tax=Polysphondylium violaceum TaxID=133409 RepID=A0A8J4PPN6_9MYCE|nr:hypothetical protein CYY_007500 [Polysphondylium violaceum]
MSFVAFNIKDRSFKSLFLGPSYILIYNLFHFLKKGSLPPVNKLSHWNRVNSTTIEQVHHKFWNGRNRYFLCGVQDIFNARDAKCIFIVFENENRESFNDIKRLKEKAQKEGQAIPLYAIGYKRPQSTPSQFSCTKEMLENEYGTIKYIEFDAEGPEYQRSIFLQTILNIFESIYQAEVDNEITAHLDLVPQDNTYNEEVQSRFDNGLYINTHTEFSDQSERDRYEQAFFMVFRNKYTFRYIFKYIQRLHRSELVKVYNFFSMPVNYMISYRKFNILKERLLLYGNRQPLEYINIVNLLRCKELDLELLQLIYQHHSEAFDDESTEYWLNNGEVRTLKFSEIIENAVVSGSIDNVKFLIQQGFPLSYECKDIAAKYGHQKLLDFLCLEKEIQLIPKKKPVAPIRFGINQIDHDDFFYENTKARANTYHNNEPPLWPTTFEKKKKKSFIKRLFGFK